MVPGLPASYLCVLLPRGLSIHCTPKAALAQSDKGELAQQGQLALSP